MRERYLNLDQMKVNPGVGRELTFSVTSPLQTRSNVPKVSRISLVVGLTWIIKAVAEKGQKNSYLRRFCKPLIALSGTPF